MKKLNQHTVGMATGAFLALVHTVWSLMVAMGVAQAYLDFVFGMHFLDSPYTVGEFNLGTAIGLVAITFAVGYAAGWVFAWLWNSLLGKK